MQSIMILIVCSSNANGLLTQHVWMFYLPPQEHSESQTTSTCQGPQRFNNQCSHQLTGFYMMGILVVKGLMTEKTIEM